MKRILLLSSIFAYSSLFAQINVNESFEGSYLPNGFGSFTDENLTDVRIPSYNSSAGTPCEGEKAVTMNLYDSFGKDNWYLVYSSNHSNQTDLNYSFKYLAKAYNENSVVNGTLSVEYSIDNGTTWVMSTPEITISNDTPCTEITGNILGNNIPTGSNFKIRIVSKRVAPGDYHIGIDQLTIKQSAIYPPNCTNIIAPVDGQVVNNLTPNISYESVLGASQYKISVGTTAGGTDVLNNVDNNNLLTYTIPSSANLQPQTVYYVTVTPSNNIGDATNCMSVSFNTGINIPFNDDCANAIPVTTFPYINTQTNLHLSTNNNGFINICQGAAMNDGVWYTFVGNGADHTITISNLEDGFDAELQVYSGNCNELFCVTKADNGNGNADETTTFQTINGTTYYVNIGNYSGHTDYPEGNFTITIDNGTSSNSAPNCTTITSPTDGEIVNTATPNISYESVLGASTYKISVGTTIGGTDIIDSLENNNLLSYTIPASANLQPQTIYYITVIPSNDIGDATNCTSISFNTGDSIPFNDNCANAIAIANIPYEKTQSNAHLSTNNNGFINICQGIEEGMNDGLWYTFVGNGHNHTVTISNVQSDFNPELQVYSGNCGELSCVARADNGGVGSNETVTFQTTNGIVYYINVGSYSADNDLPEGNFTISIDNESADISKTKKETSLKIFPNPVENILYIEGTETEYITLVDMSGKIVETQRTQNNSANLENIKQGQYVLIIKQKDGSIATFKITKM